MSVKAVLFDLDDTLLWDARSVQEAFDATCALAAKEHAIDPQKLESAVRQEARQLYEQYETYPFVQNIGINPFEALWANFNDDYDEMFHKLKQIAPEYRRAAWTRGLAACGIDDPRSGEQLAQFFYMERRNRPIVYDETFEVLDRLAGKYKLLLLTNGSPDLQNEKLSQFPRLAAYFDHIVVSGSFGQGKPSPQLFQHVMDLLAIHANEGMMIGDKLTTDIRGALNVGMTSVWLNRENRAQDPEIVPDYEIKHLLELFPILEKLQ